MTKNTGTPKYHLVNFLGSWAMGPSIFGRLGILRLGLVGVRFRVKVSTGGSFKVRVRFWLGPVTLAM